MIEVKIVCEAGHFTTMEFEDLSEEWVQNWCGLIDGTSPMYVSSPRDCPGSQIAHCGICGKLLNASIVNIWLDKEEQP